MDNIFEKIIIVDTETTSVKPLESELIELATGTLNQDFSWNIQSRLIKPNNPIPAEASAIHNITNKMVSDKNSIEKEIPWITSVLKFQPGNYFVAHNSEFDRAVLSQNLSLRIDREDQLFLDNQKNWICTWRLAKVVYSVVHQLNQHSLAYLRYRLELNVPDELPNHRADTDVMCCGELFLRLVQDAISAGLISTDLSGDEFLKKLHDLCWGPITLAYFPFGKHKGVKFSEVPQDYLEWAVLNLDSLKEGNERYDPDLAHTIVQELSRR